MTVRSLIILSALVLLAAPQVACGGCTSEEETLEEGTGEAGEAGEPAPEKPDEPEPKAPAADKAEKKRSKAREDKGRKGKRGKEAEAKAPGAIDAKAKRLADRKTREADLKKRADRRRENTKKTTTPTVPAASGSPSEANILERAAPTRPSPQQALGASNASGTKPLKISRYLSITDARKITGEASLSKGQPLAGIQVSANYNNLYFAPQIRSKFGVSVQVWKEKIRRDANDRFKKMLRDYPNAEETNAVPPKAIFSHFGGEIMTVSFADLTKSVVVSVSCGTSVCDGEELVALAKAVKGRL